MARPIRIPAKVNEACSQGGGGEESHPVDPVDLEDQLPRNLDTSAWFRTMGEVFVPQVGHPWDPCQMWPNSIGVLKKHGSDPKTIFEIGVILPSGGENMVVFFFWWGSVCGNAWSVLGDFFFKDFFCAAFSYPGFLGEDPKPKVGSFRNSRIAYQDRKVVRTPTFPLEKVLAVTMATS